MKLKLSLVICLAIATNSFCQKITLITDSTGLKQYFGREVKRIYVGPDKKTIEKMETVINLQSPIDATNSNQPKDGLKGGPIVRVIRNDHATILNKKIKSEVQRLDMGSLPKFATINYRAYLSGSAQIDSLILFISYRDTTQATNANYLRREKLITSIDTKTRNRFNEAFGKAVREFSQIMLNVPSKHLNGYFMLNFEKKDLETYLSSLKDTVSFISLAGFGLQQFPNQLKRFRNLKSIDLKDNFIEEVSIDKKDFPKLKIISFQNNLLRDKHLMIKGGLKIETLNLNNNHFSKIPKTNKRVKHLFLANNSINEVSKADVKKIKKVESLNLYANEVTSISPRIYKTKKLKEIDLYRNKLSHLPEKITRLKNLESLALSHNNLTNLPATVSNIKSLKMLYVHHNKLLDLPELPINLEALDVGYNRLEKVENNVKPLRNLKTLDYSNNFVKGDLDFLLSLPDIKEIYLFENKYASTEDEEKYFSDVFYKLVSKGIKVK